MGGGGGGGGASSDAVVGLCNSNVACEIHPFSSVQDFIQALRKTRTCNQTHPNPISDFFWRGVAFKTNLELQGW